MSYVRTIRAALLAALRRVGGSMPSSTTHPIWPGSLKPSLSTTPPAKAAVLALTKSIARAEGPKIRVNAVAPGPIWTPFWTKPGGFADTSATLHGMERQAARVEP